MELFEWFAQDFQSSVINIFTSLPQDKQIEHPQEAEKPVENVRAKKVPKPSIENTLDFSCFFKNSSMSDMVFSVMSRNGTKIIIPAHRTLISNRSPVLKHHLKKNTKESTKVRTNVRISDVSAEEFSDFLQFFYLAKVELDPENLAGVLKMAEKYRVKDLYPVCETFIQQTLSPELYLQYYDLVLTYGLSNRLERMVERAIASTWTSYLQPTNNYDINPFLLMNILLSNELCEREFIIFNHLMAWIKIKLPQKDEPLTEERIRSELGNLIETIRFPLMTNMELRHCFRKYPQLLSSEESEDLLAYSASEPKISLTAAKRFNRGERKKEKIRAITIFFQKIELSYTETRTVFKLRWGNQAYPSMWLVSLFIEGDIKCYGIKVITDEYGMKYFPVKPRHREETGPVELGPVHVSRDGGHTEIYVVHTTEYPNTVEYLINKGVKYPDGFSLEVIGKNFSVKSMKLASIE